MSARSCFLRGHCGHAEITRVTRTMNRTPRTCLLTEPDDSNTELALGPRRDPRSPRSIIGAELVTTAGKDAIKVILGPPDLGVEAGKLPDPVDLLVPVRVGGVGVALDGDLGARGVGVPLMGHAELVDADDLVVRDLLPLGAADEMLRHQQRVAENGRVRDHADELLRGHRFPELVEERAVVDLIRVVSKGGKRETKRSGLVSHPQSRGDALPQPAPVFGVVAVGPIDEAGHQTKVILEGDIAPPDDFCASNHLARRDRALWYLASVEFRWSDVTIVSVIELVSNKFKKSALIGPYTFSYTLSFSRRRTLCGTPSGGDPRPRSSPRGGLLLDLHTTATL